MPRTKVAPNRHSWRRLAALCLIGLAMGTLVLLTSEYTSYTTTAPYPSGGTITVEYQIGVTVVFLLIAPSFLFALSWSEQRWVYGALETLCLWSGLSAACLVFGRLYLWVSGWADLAYICLLLIATYLPARYLGLAFVRMFLFSIVYGQGLCTGCGYDLTGNTSGVCPECGIEITRRTPDTERAATVRER